MNIVNPLKPSLGRWVLWILQLHLVLVCTKVQAGYLTITGNPKLKLSSTDSKYLNLKGSYEIHNKGDETAYHVFPHFQLEGWTWAGKPAEIPANGSNTWEIDEKLTSNHMTPNPMNCPEGSNCEPSNLPYQGVFPLRIRHHYKDANGYEFSAANIQRLEVGDFSSSVAANLRVPQIQGKLKIESNGQTFVAYLDLRNLGSTEKEILVSYHSSRELKILTPIQKERIAANGTLALEIAGENYSGLLGSSYALFAVMEWEDQGFRNTVTTSQSVPIKVKETKNYYLIATIASLCLGLVALWFLRRKLGFVRKVSATQP